MTGDMFLCGRGVEAQGGIMEQRDGRPGGLVCGWGGTASSFWVSLCLHSISFMTLTIPPPHYSRVRGTSSKIDHIMCITNQSSPLMLLKCISCCAKLWFKKSYFSLHKNWSLIELKHVAKVFFFYRSRQNNKDQSILCFSWTEQDFIKLTHMLSLFLFYFFLYREGICSNLKWHWK